MSKRKRDDNPGGVSRAFCDERYGQFSERVFEKLNGIDEKVDELREEKKKGGRDWRLLGFSIVGSITTGVVMLVITSLISV